MKKKIVIIVIILLVLIFVVFNFQRGNQTINKKEKNIYCEMETYTITDTGTEIDVKLKNNNANEIKIDKMEISLYNTAKQEIKKITKNLKTKLMKNQETTIKLNLKTQEIDVASVKCNLYK